MADTFLYRPCDNRARILATTTAAINATSPPNDRSIHRLPSEAPQDGNLLGTRLYELWIQGEFHLETRGNSPVSQHFLQED